MKIIQFSEYQNVHITLTKNFITKNSLFRDIVYDNHGGAIFCSAADVLSIITSCIFINNTVTKSSDNSEGGSICILKSKEVCLNCSFFETNSAYYAASFYISDRSNAFITTISQVSITNDYVTYPETHFELFGGNPLHVSNFNLSKSKCQNHGIGIDYIEEYQHNVFSYVYYAECEAGQGYFLNDQGNLPKNYYVDKCVFINNNIADFFAPTSRSDINPSFFDCNFIFESKIPNFNFKVNFFNCYITPEIPNYGKASFNNTLAIENGINNKIKDFLCDSFFEKDSSTNENSHYQYFKYHIFTSLFIISRSI